MVDRAKYEGTESVGGRNAESDELSCATNRRPGHGHPEAAGSERQYPFWLEDAPAQWWRDRCRTAQRCLFKRRALAGIAVVEQCASGAEQNGSAGAMARDIDLLAS